MTSFFRATPPPVFLDEIQYAPGLFPYMKMLLDASQQKGQFFLSGSQQFHMLKNVSESLAGRVGLLQLHGLSLREIHGVSFRQPSLPAPAYLEQRRHDIAHIEYNALWKHIQRGSMAAMVAQPAMETQDAVAQEWQMFYAAYTKSFIERDVRHLTQVGDEMKFLRFTTAIAASTAQLMNYASIARDVGVSQPTVERWVSILRASHLVYLLKPYHNNITKRAVKTPKMYFLDTGLAAYLTRWNTPEALRNGAMSGAFFETFVVAEVLKSYANAGILEPPLYFYRDKDMREIDLLIMDGDTVYPTEIKKHADPNRSDVAAFSLLDRIPGIQRGPGGVFV